MDRGLDSQFISNEHFKNVSFIGPDQRPRLLTVDEIHLTGEAVCEPVRRLREPKSLDVYAQSSPGALKPLDKVKL